jgi:hypothetical protein
MVAVRLWWLFEPFHEISVEAQLQENGHQVHKNTRKNEALARVVK